MARRIIRYVELGSTSGPLQDGEVHAVALDPKTARPRKKTLCGLATTRYDRRQPLGQGWPLCTNCQAKLEG